MKFAVIADIHSNIEALNAVLIEIERQGIKMTLCAGDLVGFNTNPNQVIDKVRKKAMIVVAGDHDKHVVDMTNLTYFDEYARSGLVYNNEKLTDENKAYLQRLPDKFEQKIDDKNVLMIHGTQKNPLYGKIELTSTDIQMQREALGYDILITANTHVPFIRRLSTKIVVNPGSVGQPRDNNPAASFAIIDPEHFTARLMRVEYDIDSAAKKIIVSTLPSYLADRLYRGR